MKTGKIVCIMQARMGSTRLPGKVMKEILGKTVLEHDLERITQIKSINKIIVATTTLKEDNIIIDTVNKFNQSNNQNVSSYRGKNTDVLDRYYRCAKIFNADIIVRITSDCPLVDPSISEMILNAFMETDCNYICNGGSMEKTYPNGLDTEVFTFKALETAWLKATSDYDKEHVTEYIVTHPDKFKIINVKQNVNLSHLRWTLDYPEDFEFIKEVYERLYPKNKYFATDDILQLLEQEPQLSKINSMYPS